MSWIIHIGWIAGLVFSLLGLLAHSAAADTPHRERARPGNPARPPAPGVPAFRPP